VRHHYRADDHNAGRDPGYRVLSASGQPRSSERIRRVRYLEAANGAYGHTPSGERAHETRSCIARVDETIDHARTGSPTTEGVLAREDRGCTTHEDTRDWTLLTHRVTVGRRQYHTALWCSHSALRATELALELQRGCFIVCRNLTLGGSKKKSQGQHRATAPPFDSYSLKSTNL